MPIGWPFILYCVAIYYHENVKICPNTWKIVTVKYSVDNDIQIFSTLSLWNMSHYKEKDYCLKIDYILLVFQLLLDLQPKRMERKTLTFLYL